MIKNVEELRKNYGKQLLGYYKEKDYPKFDKLVHDIDNKIGINYYDNALRTLDDDDIALAYKFTDSKVARKLVTSLITNDDYVQLLERGC